MSSALKFWLVSVGFNLIAKLIPISNNLTFICPKGEKKSCLYYAIKKVMKYSVYVSSPT